MSDEAVTVPHFWAILQSLPLAVIYKEHLRSQILVNDAACRLLNLEPDSAVLSLSTMQHVALADPQSNKQFTLVNNPLLKALGGTELQQDILLVSNNSTQKIRLSSRSIELSYTLHNSMVLTLEPLAPSEPTPRLLANSEETSIEELEEALAFDKLLSLISTALINVQDDALDQHIEDALAAVGEFCHADRSYVFQFNEDITVMSNTHEWVRQGISSHKDNLQDVPRNALPHFYKTIARDLVYSVNEVSKLPPEAQAEKDEFDAEDIQSVLCCAMLAGDKLIGFVGCDMVSRLRNWTGNDLRRLKLVGEMIGNTLQNVSYRQSLQHMQQQLLAANQELQRQASQDGLTGIANRRGFDETLQQELQRCARNNLPISLIMIDIDRFKDYNDQYGHQAGDDALKRVAQALHSLLKRQGELAARYGGEEFALILSGTDSTGCEHIARQVQQQIQQLAIAHQASDIADQLTVSLGCCTYHPDKVTTANQLIRQADNALYQAKKAGRNQIIFSSS